MGTIYLENILCKILIYPKYIFNVTIISRPFMLIKILEYICNMAIHTHSKYIFVNLNIPNYVFLNTKNTQLYTYEATTKFVVFAINGR
jgi:hypothetical protein